MLAARRPSRVCQSDGPIALHAEGFVGLQWLAWSSATSRIDPGGYLATINPDMMGRIPPMWQPFLQPLAHDVRMDMQFLRQFRRGVQHGQETGRADNDSMGQAIFHKRVFASQVEFCA